MRNGLGVCDLMHRIIAASGHAYDYLGGKDSPGFWPDRCMASTVLQVLARPDRRAHLIACGMRPFRPEYVPFDGASVFEDTARPATEATGIFAFYSGMLRQTQPSFLKFPCFVIFDPPARIPGGGMCAGSTTMPRRGLSMIALTPRSP
jgi:hypothetical protein